MYLKSIEVHGFKSFANKIVFTFHNGITAIVGPNGSGKSNVGDAVRWVLGEQRAKQLRGVSMQDIIFAGTESRKPLGYAYVAITLDNSDHQLPVDYEEVTIARRVYRSGESEYLMNGTVCRLKDVNELFYDTGIGKEGYSIIGQGQIERILNGKPEERRELFDEATGIVKYKRRKATAQKKLENEKINLIRVNDILLEMEKQIMPLQRQSEVAKVYLQKKDDLKTYDVNMFLLEIERINNQQKELHGHIDIAENALGEVTRAYEESKTQYTRLEEQMEHMDKAIDQTKNILNANNIEKSRLEGQLNVLNEQINTAKLNDEHLQNRMRAIQSEREERQVQKDKYENEAVCLEERIEQINFTKTSAQAHLEAIQEEIEGYQRKIEDGKSEIIELLNERASTRARQQRYDTMLEQIQIRKAELNQRLFKLKSEEEIQNQKQKEYDKQLIELQETMQYIQSKQKKIADEISEKRTIIATYQKEIEHENQKFYREKSRLESLKNMTERYDGYGNSIRRVMEQKNQEPGLIGVVADIIKVEKKFEIAIETALGGGIQNVVTADESVAKRMIEFLKRNKYGRATFLPLTSVGKKGNLQNPKAMEEKGVIGLAHTLVQVENEFLGLAQYLLGRTIVVDTIENGIALAKKYQHMLRIVTLEGESLNPGGSMTGGAFKNTSNLLGRRREIEELEECVEKITLVQNQLHLKQQEEKDEIELLGSESEELKVALQTKELNQNTIQMSLKEIQTKTQEAMLGFHNLQSEHREIDFQLEEIEGCKEEIQQEIQLVHQKEQEIEAENKLLQNMLEEKLKAEEIYLKKVGDIQLDLANINAQETFLKQNKMRIYGELSRFDEEYETLLSSVESGLEDVTKKREEIEANIEQIKDSEENHKKREQELASLIRQREELSLTYKGFYQKRETLSKNMSDLDKEVFRLSNQREKLEETYEFQNDYMWEEYEMTYHNALSLRNESLQNISEMKTAILELKEEIRKLGAVNVNAIEDYKSLSERYNFLKEQRDDLVTAEQTLLEIIQELDRGMRAQFEEKFIEIQREFDKAFKELFGGGKGTLALMEDEDILESGIRIIAQPPGKKLQNMMQLSGGEKSLTAISLLFAIQNLKPSPFCLLDEIEAALDDSNVIRFAKYLHKLTKNTQFIIITHRRGTMAAADRLYGITMQEKGISTLVSVNLIENELDK